MYKQYYITSFRNKTRAALYGLNYSIANKKPIIFKVREFFWGNIYDIYWVECIETPGVLTAIGRVRGIGNSGGINIFGGGG